MGALPLTSLQIAFEGNLEAVVLSNVCEEATIVHLVDFASLVEYLALPKT